MIGAPKCGTTSMFYYLTQHPNFYDPGAKEPHYLCADFPGVRAIRTSEDYEALFSRVESHHHIIGEGSMTYMYSSIAPKRIMEINPAAKILLILRNPVDIVHSWHSQSLSTLNEDQADFKTAWGLQEERALGQHLPPRCVEPFFVQYREIGLLGKYIEQVLTVIPKNQLKMVFHEDFRDDIRSVYDEVIEFLGLPPFTEVDFTVLNSNRANRSNFVARFTEKQAGARFTRKLSPLKKLLGLKKVSLRQSLRKINQTAVKRAPLDPEFRCTLTEAFREDIGKLADISGRNLDHWLEQP
jgi:hypothetical protein